MTEAPLCGKCRIAELLLFVSCCGWNVFRLLCLLRLFRSIHEYALNEAVQAADVMKHLSNLIRRSISSAKLS